MYNLVKPILVRETLLDRNIKVISTREFAILFQLDTFQTEYMLAKLTRDGLLMRLKKGIYTLKTDSPTQREIANAMYKPSYISFDFALSYYNLIPEIVYEVTSATTKPTRLFTTVNNSYGYYTIKTQAYTGYILKKDENESFIIAEPEKAVVDYIYALTLGQRGLLGKRTVNDRLNVRSLNYEKLQHYALAFESAKLTEWISNLLQSNKI